MRWWAIPLAVALGWLVFTLTPLWTLYQLSRAVAERDAAAVERHVDLRTLRLSMTRQLTDALRAAPDGDSPERRSIADAAAVLAMPMAEALITPRVIADLLDDGSPQSLDLPDLGRDERSSSGRGLRIDDLGRVLEFYAHCEMRGFRTVVVPVPPDRPREEQFRIRMRFRDWSWHVSEIELNPRMRERIAAAVRRMPKPGEPRADR